MSDIVSRLRDQSLTKQGEAWRRQDGGQDLSIGAQLADDAADEIERLRIRETALVHWLHQVQLKAEFAKEKAKLARDNADAAIQYAIDAETCAIRALSQHNRAGQE